MMLCLSVTAVLSLVIVLLGSQLQLDVLPQLTFVVVLVPAADGRVQHWLQDKGSGKDGADKDRVSLEDGVVDGGVNGLLC